MQMIILPECMCMPHFSFYHSETVAHVGNDLSLLTHHRQPTNYVRFHSGGESTLRVESSSWKNCVL